MSFDPTPYKALSFDIYSTLIDWESGICTALLPLLSRTNPQPSRKDILIRYTNVEHAIQEQEPTLAYSRILEKVYGKLCEELGVAKTEEDGEEARVFGQSIGKWPAFTDTVAAMQILQKHYKLIVLSNVDHSSFSRTLSGPLKGVKFDAIYTAEDIGSYKPDLRNFEYLFEHVKRDFGIEKEEILHVANSLKHDHRPAKAIGMRPGVWIERKGGVMGGSLEDVRGEVELGGVYPDLRAFAAVVKDAFEK
jgi:2-haloalkanoic acid dehalogenase type II